MLSTAGVGQRGVGGSVEAAADWMKAGGTIYHSVSLLSSQNPRLFFSTPKSSDNNRQRVEPFLTSVFHTQSPAD